MKDFPIKVKINIILDTTTLVPFKMCSPDKKDSFPFTKRDRSNVEASWGEG